jgi:hypothetical protein
MVVEKEIAGIIIIITETAGAGEIAVIVPAEINSEYFKRKFHIFILITKSGFEILTFLVKMINLFIDFYCGIFKIFICMSKFSI